MSPKSQHLPPSAFSEPSEPSDLKPEDKPKEQLRGAQEENPQVVVTQSDKTREKKRNTTSPGKGDKDIPPSAFAEPSDPADLALKDKSREQVSRPQEENPQVVVTVNEKAAKQKKGSRGAKL